MGGAGRLGERAGTEYRGGPVTAGVGHSKVGHAGVEWEGVGVSPRFGSWEGGRIRDHVRVD